MPVPARGSARKAVAAAALAVLAPVVAGCSGGYGTADTSAAAGASRRPVATGNTLDQPVSDAVAGTSLVDQRGRRLSLRSLRGTVVVLAPLLTMCQETCPMTTAELHRAAEDVSRGPLSGRVVFLEVTVDPRRDTVRRMHAYAALYGAVPGWRLVTGRPAAVQRLWRSLGVTTERAPTHEPVRDWMTGRLLQHSYDVHHQDVVLVIGADGRLRWITVGHPDARGTRLPVTLHRFLDDEGRRNLARPTAAGASAWSAHDVEQAVRYVARLHAHG